MKKKLFRQGDVLLIPVDKIPDTKLKTLKRATLAFGEVTGHHHTIHDGAVGLAEEATAAGLADFIAVEKEAVLTHQEHDPITVPTGNYEVVRQTEYTPQALRNVAD